MSRRPIQSVVAVDMSCSACERCSGNGQFCVFGGPFVVRRADGVSQDEAVDCIRPHNQGPERA